MPAKVLMVFFTFWPENIKKAFISLQALRLKLNSLNQTCISLKSIMQVTKTIFSYSAIFIEKKTAEDLLWAKSEFFWEKHFNHPSRKSMPRHDFAVWIQSKGCLCKIRESRDKSKISQCSLFNTHWEIRRNPIFLNCWERKTGSSQVVSHIEVLLRIQEAGKHRVGARVRELLEAGRCTVKKCDPGMPNELWINSFSQQKYTFSLQLIFYPLFLNEDGRILKNGLSKLHYRFRRYSTLTKTILLEFQYLQSYVWFS